MSAAKASKKKPVADVQDALTPPANPALAGAEPLTPTPDTPRAKTRKPRADTNEGTEDTLMPVAEPKITEILKDLPTMEVPLSAMEVAPETAQTKSEVANGIAADAITKTAARAAAKAAKKAAAAPVAEVVPDADAKPTTKAAKKTAAEPVVAAVSAPVVEPAVKPIVEPIVEAAAEPVAEPIVVQAAAFRALNLSEQTMRAIIEAGFEAPTPIQEQSIPVLLAGHDLIGQAQTGTGKTAAFALPMAEKLDATLNYPQAIVLLPTRELCIQVAQETHNLSKYTPFARGSRVWRTAH